MKINYFIIPLITILVAVLGSFLTSSGGGAQNPTGWYSSINKPEFTPSGKIIGSVWTVIFILTAISALIVWNSSNVLQDKVLWIGAAFLLNAFLNVFWSYLFFKMHFIGAALIEMLFLELSVIALIILIYPISVLAMVLLIPYAVWVLFATYLTFSIWRLN